jgi:hypothetical protein
LRGNQFQFRVHPITKDAALAVAVEELQRAEAVLGQILRALEPEVKPQHITFGLLPVHQIYQPFVA